MVLLLLVFILFFLACGGKSERQEINLKFMGQVEAEFFSKVVVRVSGKEFRPTLADKEGPFYPGDKIRFDINIPEGEERLIEALVYDPQSKPVYYGSTVVNIPYGDEIVINLYPTIAVVRSFEEYADGFEPAYGEKFFLLSEDLFSINYQDTTAPQELGFSHSYLAGKYIAYKNSDNGIVYSYLDVPEDSTIYIQKELSFKVSLPPGEESLYLSGSWNGIAFDGDTLTIPSKDLLLGGKFVLSGVGSALYISTGNSETISFLEESCRTGNEDDCIPLSISFKGIQPLGYEIYGEVGGLKFRLDRNGYFWKRPDLSYHIKVFGELLESSKCRGIWELWIPLGQDFSGEAQLDIKVKVIYIDKLEEKATLKVTSAKVYVEAVCDAGADIYIGIPYFEEENLQVEVLYDSGFGKGTILKFSEDRLILPKGKLDFFIEDRKDHLFISFPRSEPMECSLELWNEDFRIKVPFIPAYRTYFKIRKLWKPFEELTWNHNLKCWDKEERNFLIYFSKYDFPSAF